MGVMERSQVEKVPRRTAACKVDPRARRAFHISSVLLAEREIPISEHRPLELPFADLLTFSCLEADRRPILVIAPLAGAFPVLLRDLVLGLLRHRATVAVTDWFDACFVPKAAGRFGLEDNISYVLHMTRTLGSNPHIVAVCQGVIPALAATALLSANEPEAAPCSLTLVAGPIDPLANPTRAVRLARSHPLSWFERNVIETVPSGYPGEGRRVYPKALQLRTLTAYIARHTAEGRELFWKLMNDDGADPVGFPFWSLMLSLMDLPAEFFLEHIRSVFHNQDLSRGTLQVGGARIDLRAIQRTALMTLEGEEDDIAGPGQTQAAHALCPAIPAKNHEHVAVPRSGHFSLFHGAICRSRVVPEMAQFMMRAEQNWTGSHRKRQAAH
jgi:poly(3-hydroxybutyrate) depolymerase